MRAAAIAVLAALCLFAQVSRDGYRNAYKVWRLADPNLERDAANGGLQLEPRVEKVASDATQYQAARKLFLQQLEQEGGRKFGWLDSPPLEPPPPLTSGTLAFLTAESKTVQHSIDTFAGDPDPGIRQLRGMLQREGVALKALTNAIGDRDKTSAAASAATAALEQRRSRVLDDAHAIAAGWPDTVTQTDRESAAWADYYKLLSSGAQNIAPATSELPTPTVAASVPETTARVMTPAPGPLSAGTSGTSPSEPPGGIPARANSNELDPALKQRIAADGFPLKPSITPVPLIRYTGEWIFPATNGLYHGAQPESADLVVNEDNGHASGSLTARFNQERGSPRDADVHFEFSGQFENERNQVFTLESSDGSKGTVELIPGPAFNLIEVNFQIEAKAGKLGQGDMILVKK